jgi:hypothetical protein
MRDVSKELWYIHRTFIKIFNDFQGKVFYTTGSIREKYELESYTRVLPRLKKNGPGWAYLHFRASYIAPKDLDPEDYVVIYELFSNKKFHMDPGIHEPDNHPYIVIRDISQIVEIKLFELIDGQPTLMRDYDQGMRF